MAKCNGKISTNEHLEFSPHTTSDEKYNHSYKSSSN